MKSMFRSVVLVAACLLGPVMAAEADWSPDPRVNAALPRTDRAALYAVLDRYLPL